MNGVADYVYELQSDRDCSPHHVGRTMGEACKNNRADVGMPYTYPRLLRVRFVEGLRRNLLVFRSLEFDDLFIGFVA